MLMKIVYIFLLCVFSCSTLAQDERFYRSIFNGDLFEQKVTETPFLVEVKSPRYTLDLNRDGSLESIQTLKRDGIDYIRVNDSLGNQMFLGKLSAKGNQSSIFKAQFSHISQNVDVLLLYYYEGHTQTAKFEGSARLYILTIIDKDLKKITLAQGPYFWTEREKTNGKYWNRRYSVNTVDYNKDGVREISVSFNKIQRIYVYNKDGMWNSF